MMTDIIVEDGSGVPNANAYTTVSGVDEYCSMFGYSSWTSASTDVKKTSMFRAKRYLDGFSWKGNKVERTQSSAFPRENLVDDEGFEIATDVVPQEVVDAFCEASYLFLPDSDVDLEPILDKEDYVVQESFVDVASTTYGREKVSPKSTVISYMLRGLLKSQFIVSVYRG